MAYTGRQAAESFEHGVWGGAGLIAGNAAAAWRREGAYQAAAAGRRVECARAAAEAVAEVDRETEAGLRADVVALRATADRLHRTINRLDARLTGAPEDAHPATPTTERGKHELTLASVRLRIEIGSQEEQISEMLEDLEAAEVADAAE